MGTFRKPRFHRIAYKLEQMSLQQRLVLSYILIILLPSVLLSFYIFRGLTGETIDDIRKNAENTLTIERVHVQNNIETMRRAAQLFTSNPEVLDYLTRRTEPSAAELIAFDKTTVQSIVRVHFHNPNIEHIRLFMDNPVLYELWPVFFKESRVAGEPWHRRVLDAGGKQVWAFSRSDPELIRSRLSEDNPPVPKISLLQEIRSSQGHLGIIQVDMRLSVFFPNTFHPLSGDRSQMIVLDDEGGLIVNPDHPFLRRSGLTEAAILEAFQAARSAGGSDGSIEFRFGGTRYLLAYAFLEPPGAHMLFIESLESVYEGINRTRNRIIGAHVVLFLLLTAATYLINKIILKKLRLLTQSMKRMRSGDFRFEPDIRGGGEVGELAHHFRKLVRQINELIADAVRKKAYAKEAELTTLKNQIDSHFLYNTLENIKMMAEINGQQAISDALTSLGGMMRYSMRWTSEFVRLRDELNHIVHYVNIVNLRFDGRVKLVLDVPEALGGQELLKMTLQPLVENAVKHGFRGAPLTVGIRAEAEGGAIRLEVSDDGAGMSPEQAEALNRKLARDDASPAPDPAAGPADVADPDGTDGSRPGGIGLINVHRRIRMHYGKEYGLRVQCDRGITRVQLRIPHAIRSEGENDRARATDRG